MIQKAYLMTLEEYTKNIVPLVLEFKKFLKQNNCFKGVSYGGYDLWSYPELQQAILEKKRVSVSFDFSKENKYETPEQLLSRHWLVDIKKDAPASVIAKKNEYVEKLNDIFDAYYVQNILGESDNAKSNKRAVKYAIDREIYTQLLKEGLVEYDYIDAVAKSVGVNLPKKVLESLSASKLNQKKSSELFSQIPLVNSAKMKELIEVVDSSYGELSKVIEEREYERTTKNISIVLDKFEITHRALSQLVEYEGVFDTSKMSFIRQDRVIAERSGKRDYVSVYTIPPRMPNWDANLRQGIKEYVEKLKVPLFGSILQNFKKISAPIESISKVSVNVGHAGFEGVFSFVFKNKGSFIFETKAILAGGYNIQVLHLRYISDFKKVSFPDGTEKKSASLYEVSKGFSSEYEIKADGGKISTIDSRLVMPENITDDEAREWIRDVTGLFIGADSAKQWYADYGYDPDFDGTPFRIGDVVSYRSTNPEKQYNGKVIGFAKDKYHNVFVELPDGAIKLLEAGLLDNERLLKEQESIQESKVYDTGSSEFKSKFSYKFGHSEWGDSAFKKITPDANGRVILAFADRIKEKDPIMKKGMAVNFEQKLRLDPNFEDERRFIKTDRKGTIENIKWMAENGVHIPEDLALEAGIKDNPIPFLDMKGKIKELMILLKSNTKENDSSTKLLYDFNALPPNQVEFVSDLFHNMESKHKYNKTSLEHLASKHGIDDKNTAKELAELTICLMARDVVKEDLSDKDKYDKIVNIYKNQVNLSHRTSDSIAMQQYSTPAPIGYLMGLYCGMGVSGVEVGAKTVYAYKRGDVVIFYKNSSELVSATIIVPSVVTNGIQTWSTTKGIVAENNMLPRITSAKKESAGQGYKSFKGMGGGKSYVITFADGSSFTSHREERADAIEQAVRHRLFNVKDYPKTVLGNNESVTKLGFEPSAGNGLLTIAASPKDFIVNDIDKQRYADLKFQKFKEVLNQDATLPFKGFDKKFDAVITNPPFGTIDGTQYHYTEHLASGDVRKQIEISSLEQLMALLALDNMKDDGKSAIIIGGHTKWDDKGRISAGKNRIFFVLLNQLYNVEDVINIDGHALYSRQGTGFDTRIILINGRKKISGGFPPLADKKLPVTENHSTHTISSFDDLWIRIENLMKKSI